VYAPPEQTCFIKQRDELPADLRWSKSAAYLGLAEDRYLMLDKHFRCV
jgi:hypothetical protein